MPQPKSSNDTLMSIEARLARIEALLPLSVDGLTSLQQLQVAICKNALGQIDPRAKLADDLSDEVVRKLIPGLLDGLMSRVLALLPLVMPDKAGAVEKVLTSAGE